MDIRKKYKIVTLMVGIFATVLGGLLSSYGYARIFQIQGLLFLVIIALLLPVPYNPQHEFVEKSYLQMIKKSVSVLRQKDIFLPTIFIYSFLAIEAGVYIGFQTQYVGELQLPKEYLGIGLGAFVLFAAIFTSYLPKQKRVLSKGFFVVIALCFIIPLLLNLIYPSMIALLLLYLTQVIRPMDIPVEDRILNTVTDNTGSTVLSFVGFYERIGFMIITVLVHVFGGSPILTLLILSMLLGISCLLFYKNSYSDT